MNGDDIVLLVLVIGAAAALLWPLWLRVRPLYRMTDSERESSLQWASIINTTDTTGRK